MASKKWKGKLCVYCGKTPATTADHVVARQFFLLDKRDNLPKVPACAPCNSEKSGHETYLTAVLPFGGRHADALSTLQDMVPPRLAKHAKLQATLRRGRERLWRPSEGGVLMPALAIPFDHQRMVALFQEIVRGLAWHHWAVILADGYQVEAGALSREGEAIFSTLIEARCHREVHVDLGDGAFVYDGYQGVDYPELTVWRFTVFGGIELAGDPAAPGATTTTIWGWSARKPTSHEGGCG